MTKQKYQCQYCGRIVVCDEDKFEEGAECKKCGGELVLEEDSEYEAEDESEDEEESDEDTYECYVWCKNCGYTGLVDIPVNKNSEDCLNRAECGRCPRKGYLEVLREE